MKEKDWKLIRVIQSDLPEDREPFLTIAEKIGWTEEEVKGRIKELMQEGIIKRFGALVRHQELGFEGNSMVAWSVPKSEVERVGTQMAGYPFISHCYERVVRPQWPYTIYTMLHASTREEAKKYVEKVSEETGIKGYRILYTVKEWKKKSMEYL